MTHRVNMSGVPWRALQRELAGRGWNPGVSDQFQRDHLDLDALTQTVSIAREPYGLTAVADAVERFAELVLTGDGTGDYAWQSTSHVAAAIRDHAAEHEPL